MPSEKTHPFSLLMPRAFGALLALAWIGPAWLILYPFNFAAGPVNHWLVVDRIHKINFTCNLILFFPATFMAVGWMRIRGRQVAGAVALAALAGSLTSLAGETLQVWLPGRNSSMIDLLSNSAGALAGALAGARFVGPAAQIWNTGARYVEARPRLRRLILIAIGWFVVKGSPFDFSLETLDLKLSLKAALAAGWPLSRTRAYLTGAAATGQAFHDMIRELAAGGLNLAVLALLTVAIGNAAAEHRRIIGRGPSALPVAAALGIALAFAGELMQWFVTSRSVNATDIAGGLAGALLGCAWLVAVKPADG